MLSAFRFQSVCDSINVYKTKLASVRRLLSDRLEKFEILSISRVNVKVAMGSDVN
jgi:hypothetical protein